MRFACNTLHPPAVFKRVDRQRVRCGTEPEAKASKFSTSLTSELSKISQIDFTTGFPVPIHRETQIERTERLAEELVIPQKKVLDQAIHEGEVSPVFRTSPYDAEERRRKRGTTQAQILFLDEGNDCRAVLGAGILSSLVKDTPIASQLSVSSASIGPSATPTDASELLNVLREMGPQLDAVELIQSERVFCQENDPIDNDLLLVMDRFDREEVYREVAVLDAINPNGYYTSRLKLLGEFCRTLPNGIEDPDVIEISDPWYGTVTTEERAKALKITARKLWMGCQGLATYLNMLKDRCRHGLSLQVSLTQSLRCPVMENSSLTRSVRMNNWKPVWKSNDPKRRSFYTVKDVGGEMRIVRKNMTPRKGRHYWKDIVNVENELKNWMRKHKTLNRLPKHKELRETGQFSLSVAIVSHGGISAFQSRLHAPSYAKRKKPPGFWEDIKNVERELQNWMNAYGSTTLPTRQRLRETGHSALSTSIGLHGGVDVMSKLLNKKGRQRGRYYWTNDDNFKRELTPYLIRSGDGLLYVPTQPYLLDVERADLLGAILRRGGRSKVASYFGWKCNSGDEVPPKSQASPDEEGQDPDTFNVRTSTTPTDRCRTPPRIPTDTYLRSHRPSHRPRTSTQK